MGLLRCHWGSFLLIKKKREEKKKEEEKEECERHVHGVQPLCQMENEANKDGKNVSMWFHKTASRADRVLNLQLWIGEKEDEDRENEKERVRERERERKLGVGV